MDRYPADRDRGYLLLYWFLFAFSLIGVWRAACCPTLEGNRSLRLSCPNQGVAAYRGRCLGAAPVPTATRQPRLNAGGRPRGPGTAAPHGVNESALSRREFALKRRKTKAAAKGRP